MTNTSMIMTRIRAQARGRHHPPRTIRHDGNLPPQALGDAWPMESVQRASTATPWTEGDP